MAVTVTSSVGMTAQAREFYAKETLYWSRPQLVYNRPGFAKKNTIARNQGQRISWRRPQRLAAALTPLTESVTPAPSSMQYVKVFLDALQYGNFVAFSDKVSVTSIDPILADNTKILAENAGNTIDLISRNAYIQTTNVQFVGTGNTQNDDIAQNEVIVDSDLLRARRTLARTNTKRFGDAAKGMLYAICHPDVTMDLMNTNLYKNTGYYQKADWLTQGQIPALYGIEFFETTNAPTVVNGGGITCYYTLIFGEEAFGNVDIADLEMEMIVKGLGSAGTGDPLNQRQTQGWKATHAATVLNSDFCVKLVSAVTQ